MTVGMLRQVIREEVNAFRDFESPPRQRNLREGMSSVDRKEVRDVISRVRMEAQQVNTADDINKIGRLKIQLKDIRNTISDDPADKDELRAWNNAMKEVDQLIEDYEDYKKKNPTYPEPYSYK